MSTMPFDIHDIQIPGYQVIRFIGKGGMAQVYLCQKEGMSEPVALKIINAKYSMDDNFLARFQKEVKILGDLHHPNIVKYYGAGRYKQNIFMALEYIPNKDLKHQIRQKLITTSDIVRWYGDMASALDYSHNKGYIHRDIKPENILLRANNSAVITDFGIAKAYHDATQITGTGLSIGTPYYMSPEQARGRKITQKSDIYSAGVMLYELLSGVVPYDGSDPIAIGISHITKPIPPLPKEMVHWQPIVNRMMAKDVADRYESMGEAYADIKALEDNNKLYFDGPEEEATRIRTQQFTQINKTRMGVSQNMRERRASRQVKRTLNKTGSSADTHSQHAAQKQKGSGSGKSVLTFSVLLAGFVLLAFGVAGYFGYQHFAHKDIVRTEIEAKVTTPKKVITPKIATKKAETKKVVTQKTETKKVATKKAETKKVVTQKAEVAKKTTQKQSANPFERELTRGTIACKSSSKEYGCCAGRQLLHLPLRSLRVFL